MDLKTILPTLITIVILILKFSIGVNSPVRSILSMKVSTSRLIHALGLIIILPIFIAFACLMIYDVDRGASIAILLLAATPGAPLAAIKIYKAKGNHEFAILLEIIVALVSIFTIPLVLTLFSKWFAIDLSVGWLTLGKQLFLIVFLPISLGIFMKYLSKAFWGKHGKKLMQTSQLLLTVLGLLILFLFRDFLFNATLIDYLLYFSFFLAIIVSAHLLGGNIPEDRTAIAILSASRHVGIVIFIASFHFDMGEILAQLIPFMIINIVVTALYMRWRQSMSA